MNEIYLFTVRLGVASKALPMNISVGFFHLLVMQK